MSLWGAHPMASWWSVDQGAQSVGSGKGSKRRYRKEVRESPEDLECGEG